MKTKQELARRAIQIFPMSDYADRKAVIHQRKGWLRSMLKLGKKWILSADRDDAVVITCIMCACVLFFLPV
jgi:hypothetical protein